MGRLVLTREEGQSICIGEHGLLTVTRVDEESALFSFTDGKIETIEIKLPERATIGITSEAALTLSRIDGGTARVTIDAPNHIIVDREEVRQRRNNNWIAERKA